MPDQEKVQQAIDEFERGIADPASISEKYHPAEIAKAVDHTESPEKILEIFNGLGDEVASQVLTHLEDRAREIVMEHLSPAKLADVIEKMETDDAADTLATMSEERVEDVIGVLSDKMGRDVSRLLEFPEDTAGHLMQTELVSVPEDYTVSETIDKIRSMSKDVQDLHNIFVVDRSNRLAGVLPLRMLILSRPDVFVGEIVKDEPLVYATVDMDQERVAELFKHYDLISLPVVDTDMKLLGRILIDDIVDVLEEETDEDIMIMAGAHDEALVQTRSAVEMARYRLPWLASSLIGGLITGSLIWQFKVTLSEMLALTAFIPVVMGLSGNVGAQSSALVIRGIATGRIDLKSLRRYFVKEIRVGLLLGVACGVLAGGVAHMWQGSPTFGVVVGLSIFISIELAAIMGTAIPFFFKWADIDPAIAGGPIVLALNDISGIVIFFITATALLGLFG